MNNTSRDIASMKSRMNRNLLKTIGPGILFASTAIGVSHLVQSTRAGAVYGLGLLWAVVIANVLKYPFFEFGSRYANATGTSLIDGYKRLGNGMLWTYLLITLGSMFFVSAAITAVTAGFLDNLFGISIRTGWSTSSIALALLMFCGVVLSIGRYRTLDSIIKIVATVLLLSTVLAFVLTILHGPVSSKLSIAPVFSTDPIDFAFLIALMGWMPTAVDLSTWNSLWTVERIAQTGYKPTMKETLFDFNLGYIISALLAICFVTMGAFLIFGSEDVLPTSGTSFANMVVTMYTETIGSWSYLIIAAAGFAIMFGTCIAILDGYGRAVGRNLELIFYSDKEGVGGMHERFYPVVVWSLVGGTFVIVNWFGATIPKLVDLATTISFLIAPVIAIANLRLVCYPFIPAKDVPPKWMLYLAHAGTIFLLTFGIYFLVK